MSTKNEEILVITTTVYVPHSLKDLFIDWQSKLNATISTFPGFLSLEILSLKKNVEDEWTIVQRFSHTEGINRWRQSKERNALTSELKQLLGNEAIKIQEEESRSPQISGCVTEVFVTHVAPGKEAAYREWEAKINRIEAKFPGFRGVYLQAPPPNQSNNWITLLQFDGQDHLDVWLASKEREEILRESTQFSSFESHRVISSYAGWFSSFRHQEIPPVWKQTMLVLLALFPIVMLELKYLRYITTGMDTSIATFISNAISVSLLAWPVMPLTIKGLSWWLLPSSHKNQCFISLLGTVCVVFIYLLEIFIFWSFL